MSSVPVALQDPDPRSFRYPCLGPWVGWQLSCLWQKKNFKERRKGGSTDSPLTSTGLQHHELPESELGEPDGPLAIPISRLYSIYLNGIGILSQFLSTRPGQGIAWGP